MRKSFCKKYPNYCRWTRQDGGDPMKPSLIERGFRRMIDTSAVDKEMLDIDLRKIRKRIKRL